jgi:hypothetical protein
VASPQPTPLATAHVCSGCGRPARDCWTMPCLYLETYLARGRSGAAKWWKLAGYDVSVEGKRIEVAEPKEGSRG